MSYVICMYVTIIVLVFVDITRMYANCLLFLKDCNYFVLIKILLSMPYNPIFRPEMDIQFKCYHFNDKLMNTNWPNHVSVMINNVSVPIPVVSTFNYSLGYSACFFMILYK